MFVSALSPVSYPFLYIINHRVSAYLWMLYLSPIFVALSIAPRADVNPRVPPCMIISQALMTLMMTCSSYGIRDLFGVPLTRIRQKMRLGLWDVQPRSWCRWRLWVFFFRILTTDLFGKQLRIVLCSCQMWRLILHGSTSQVKWKTRKTVFKVVLLLQFSFTPQPQPPLCTLTITSSLFWLPDLSSWSSEPC